jgi:hypothetical protein
MWFGLPLPGGSVLAKGENVVARFVRVSEASRSYGCGWGGIQYKEGRGRCPRLKDMNLLSLRGLARCMLLLAVMANPLGLRCGSTLVNVCRS